VHGIVFPAPLKGHRQATRRAHFAEEIFGQRCAALLTRIPHLNERWNAIKPGIHRRTPARREHDDRILVDCRDLLD